MTFPVCRASVASIAAGVPWVILPTPVSPPRGLPTRWASSGFVVCSGRWIVSLSKTACYRTNRGIRRLHCRYGTLPAVIDDRKPSHGGADLAGGPDPKIRRCSDPSKARAQEPRRERGLGHIVWGDEWSPDPRFRRGLCFYAPVSKARKARLRPLERFSSFTSHRFLC
jgi:hypothetical protein